ncbi:MAG: GH3 auxin-responsive promoter family protein [Theionarchaea archaeon]|nr:GH3 auxin-responsive promoter family protein [Theionarchaea archaeon]
MDSSMLEFFLTPWYSALENPEEAQANLFQNLLQRYRKTAYGQTYNAQDIETISEFQEHFPVATFADFEPWLGKVKKGRWNALLGEEPVEWGMTRGTTGPSKIIPFTHAEIEERFMVGPRCLMNYVHRTGDTSIFDGHILLFIYPSVAGTEVYKDTEQPYGYSSGIYSKHLAEKVGLKLVYPVEEINRFGTRRVASESEKRLEYIYEKAHNLNVTAVIGITQLLLLFGKLSKKNHKKYPKDLWKNPLLVTSSLPGVHARYNPSLKAMYNYRALRDIYGATEGFYAQQLDERPYCFPNYDYYFFEVETKKKIKMLYDMKKGERGSLIISSRLFPRYRIGDIVKCFGNNRIVCIAREKHFNTAKYWWDRFMGYSL